MIYIGIALFIVVAAVASVYVKFLAMARDVQLNSHRINCLEVELKETKTRLATTEEALTKLVQEADVVQEFRSYNEGINNILNYSLDTAKGKK